MCCVVALMAFIGPRVAFVATWLLTDKVDVAFTDSVLVPVLGLIFLPWTALMYALCYSVADGVTGFGWILVGLGLLFDLSSYSGGLLRRRR